MSTTRVASIKHAQRESFLLREISESFSKILYDNPGLHGLFISRVRLSPDKGKCIIYFFATNGLPEYEEKKPTLVLYKASLRTALAKTMNSRYTPQLRFEYDAAFEKQQKIDNLIEKLKDEGRL